MQTTKEYDRIWPIWQSPCYFQKKSIIFHISLLCYISCKNHSLLFPFSCMEKFQNYKMLLSYDGTRYGGWQVQLNSTSIQTLVQKALETALRHEIDLTGSGRTDAGVHAIGQVAHFRTKEINPDKLLYSLNGLLPDDIRIKKIEKAADDFHARYSAKGKIYHYHLHLDRIMNPFKRSYCFHVLEKIDLPLLINAAKHFIGTHDFTSFANEAHKGSAAKDAVRTMQKLDIMEEEGGIRLEFMADGFLYKMVRNIVGTLIDVAAGRISVEELPIIFTAKDRKKAGFSAPPQGLFLVKVLYDPPFSL